jgi:hypothetical protein
MLNKYLKLKFRKIQIKLSWSDAFKKCCALGMKLLAIQSEPLHACLTKLAKRKLTKTGKIRF